MSFGFTPDQSPAPAASSPEEPAPTPVAQSLTAPPIARVATTPAAPFAVAPEISQSRPTASVPNSLPITTDFTDILRQPTRSSKPLVIGVAIIIAVLAVGAGMVLLRQHKTASVVPAGAKPGQDTAVSQQPPFTYLSPKSDPAWGYHPDTIVYDAKAGVAKYLLAFKDNGGFNVTLSQQQMPATLKPRTSANFKQLITDAKASKSFDVGLGTVYLVPAFSGPGSVVGSATAIFATDDILMFGRTDQVTSDANWTKIFQAMSMTVPSH